MSRRGAVVLGHPIEHSLSPVLHQAAYDALGLRDWTYRAIDCGIAELGGTLRELEALGLAGASLTMPLKRAVLPMLASVDPPVADVAAANTVLFGTSRGKWRGANTDVPGLVAALGPARVSAGDVVVVLGGGATATSAVAAVGALGVRQVAVFARRPEATSELQAAASRLDVAVTVAAFDDAATQLAAADLVVATTPAGAADELAGLIGGVVKGTLFDVVYSPWPTALATAWTEAGGRVIGGLELLVEQAALQVRLMTGARPPIEAMREAGRAALGA